MTLAVELLAPVNVRSAYDLAQIDPSLVSNITVSLIPEVVDGQEGGASINLLFDHRRMQLIDFIEFAHAAQPDGTRVELTYRGRSEHFQF